MKSLKERINDSDVPMLVVFNKVGNDAVEVKFLIEELRKHFGDKATILSVDASYDGNIKESYKLEEYPTWILYKKGEELMRESGERNASSLISMVERAL